jgi:hypothetical protein
MKWLGVIAMATFIVGSCAPHDHGLFAKTSPLPAHTLAASGTSGGQK